MITPRWPLAPRVANLFRAGFRRLALAAVATPQWCRVGTSRIMELNACLDQVCANRLTDP